MTIITKPVTEMKKKSPLDVPLVTAEVPVAKAEVVVQVPAANRPGRAFRDVDVERVRVHSPSEYRMTSATTVCVFLVGLLVMSVGIIGGFYLYQQCARKPMQHLRGFLNIPYNLSEGRQLYYQLDPKTAKQIGLPAQSDGNNVYPKRNGYFYESFEGNSDVERIDVPEFKGVRHGQFIHDFSFNQTGILDVNGRRCFVIPLDRNAVVFLPSFVVDIARNLMRRGTEVIVQPMRVHFPRLTKMDLANISDSIVRECYGLNMYTLVRTVSRPVSKRSAEEPVVFGSFSGKTLKVEIVNYKEMEDAEKEENESGIA